MKHRDCQQGLNNEPSAPSFSFSLQQHHGNEDSNLQHPQTTYKEMRMNPHIHSPTPPPKKKQKRKEKEKHNIKTDWHFSSWVGSSGMMPLSISKSSHLTLERGRVWWFWGPGACHLTFCTTALAVHCPKIMHYGW